MSYLIDTSWIVEHLRGNRAITEQLDAFSDEGLAVTSVTEITKENRKGDLNLLERFKPKPEDRVYIPEDSMRETTQAIFEKMGVPSDQAAEATDVLVMTDLRGVETHGVSNMLRNYVRGYSEGMLNPTPNLRVVRETPATAVMDGDRGLGIMMGRKGMQLAIDKARNVGFGTVTMFDSGHIGAVGHFAMMAAEQDMVGVCITAGGIGVLPTFAGEGRLGANPISIAAPAKTQPFFLFDVATSAVAINKTELARRVGSDMLPGWISDRQGNPIMEETPVPERGQFYSLTIGGTRENGSHKGYGLSMMTEILAGLLSGSNPSMLDETPGRSMFKNYFAAYNIDAFTDVDTFKENMDEMLTTLRETPPAPGHDRVLYPGLSEYEEVNERRAHGLPIHREVVEWFDSIANELSVPQLRRM